MENLERNAIAIMTDRPRLWLRFVDDALAIVNRYTLQATLDHLNKQIPAIQFTMVLEVENTGSCRFSMRKLKERLPPQQDSLPETYALQPYLDFEFHHAVTA